MQHHGLITAPSIGKHILLLRGLKVMRSSDLARLYNVETRVLNQAVKRNPDRSPEDFMFRLSTEETEALVSQNVMPDRKQLGGIQLFAFTEQGIAMLSSVLRSPVTGAPYPASGGCMESYASSAHRRTSIGIVVGFAALLLSSGCSSFVPNTGMNPTYRISSKTRMACSFGRLKARIPTGSSRESHCILNQAPSTHFQNAYNKASPSSWLWQRTFL